MIIMSFGSNAADPSMTIVGIEVIALNSQIRNIQGAGLGNINWAFVRVTLLLQIGGLLAWST